MRFSPIPIIEKELIPKVLVSLLFLFAGVFPNSHPLFAQTSGRILVIDSLQDEFILDSYMEILEDPTHRITIQQIIKGNADAGFAGYEPSVELNPNYAYWGRLICQNNLKDPASFKDWNLFVGSCDFFELYVLKDDQIVYADTSRAALSGVKEE